MSRNWDDVFVLGEESTGAEPVDESPGVESEDDDRPSPFSPRATATRSYELRTDRGISARHIAAGGLVGVVLFVVLLASGVFGGGDGDAGKPVEAEAESSRIRALEERRREVARQARADAVERRRAWRQRQRILSRRRVERKRELSKMRKARADRSEDTQVEVAVPPPAPTPVVSSEPPEPDPSPTGGGGSAGRPEFSFER